jgi:phage shock protein A
MGMGILDRMSTLIKSNLNAAIDKMADPGREIDQLVLEMEDQLRRARGEVQSTLATEKRERQRVEALARSGEEWQQRAERAVRAGDDALASEALRRKLEIDGERAAAERTLKEQSDYVDQLTQALRAMEQRVKEVKARKETLKVQARISRDQGRSGGKGLGSSAFDKFDQLAAGVDAAEAEVALDEELTAARHEDARSREVERKLDALDKGKEIDDRLAALKAKLEKKD